MAGMLMRIRLHLDESVHHAVAFGLRRRGIDVSLPADAELSGASDERHVTFAFAENRVVVTHDADFLRLAAAAVPHAGIVFCHNQSRSVGQMVQALEVLWLTREADTMIGSVEFI